MARPKTDALLYFNIDVKEDDNLKYIEAVYGHIGYYVVHKLWKHIYGGPGGYYCDWGEINQRLFCKENGVSVDKLKEIIDTCFSDEIRLFNREMYDKHKVLTSSGVQKRWKKIVVEAGRKNCHIKTEYDLINTAAVEFPPPKTTPTVELTGRLQGDDKGVTGMETTQSKVKESKEKESKPSLPKEVELGKVAVATSPPTPPVVKKEKKAKRELPETVQLVLNYVTERMKGKWAPGRISTVANKFFSHYSANGWMQNKGKPIVSWQHACNMWIFNEIEGTYNSYSAPVQNGSSSPTSTPKPPPEPEISKEKKDQLARDYIQDCFVDFCIGDVMVQQMLGGLYNRLSKDGMITLNDDEKARIKQAAKGDEVESKKIAVVEYFNKLKTEGRKQVYEPAV